MLRRAAAVGWIAFAATLGLGDGPAGAIVPLPPRRPDALRPNATPVPTVPPQPAVAPPQQQATPSPPGPPAAMPAASPEEVALCDGLLASGKVKAERLPPIQGADGCGVALPVKLSGIALASGSMVAIEPPATIRCGFAEGVADWIRLDLGPLLANRGGGLSKLAGVGGYQCRGRNRVVGAKLSEHASGNAIDLATFVFADKSSAKITQVAQADKVFAQVKLTACARFMTVLGPGSDGYHEDNLHLDLEVRRHGHHLCQWQLP